jgi:hypothetical protein
MRGLGFFLLVVAIAGPASSAATCNPVAPERIDHMWGLYNAASVSPNGGGDLYECVANERDRKLICRTRSANPAHPSIVVRTVTERDGQVFLVTEGDTAATCDAFLEMMRQFHELDRATMGNLTR